MGYVGITASSLHRGQGSAGSLLLDHHIWDRFFVGTLVVLLACAFGALIPLGLGVVVRLEVLLQGCLHSLALQIQKHAYKSITPNVKLPSQYQIYHVCLISNKFMFRLG